MDSILLLLLMWKNVYSAWIVIQTPATWKTMNALPEHSGHTHWAQNQFSCLFNFVSHNCIEITPPTAMGCALLAIKWMRINCCKSASFKTYYA